MSQKKKVNWHRPIQLRDGRKARFVCIDTESEAADNVIVAVCDTSNSLTYRKYHEDGRYLRHSDGNHHLDLINIPEEPITLTRYVNVLRTSDGVFITDGNIYETKELSERSVLYAPYGWERGIEVQITFTPKDCD